MKKLLLLLLFTLFFQKAFSQKDGYWDKERSTKMEISLSARDRLLFKCDDLPAGTTELIYRITLLDDNQQMAGSLVSLLKAIPDPTGISLGSAGAIYLMSKISGDDKCKYAIFTSNEGAAEYQKSGKTSQACFVQQIPLSKDAKRLSADKSPCLKYNQGTLWFGFESTNWLMKQKIILEIVPWVDTKLSRGWNLENRKLIIDQCKTSTLAQKMTNSDDFCICVEEKIQKQFRFDEFQKLLQIEKSKIYKDFGTSCYSENGVSEKIYADLRASALFAIQKSKYGFAIDKLTTIIQDGQGNALDYANLGYCYLITKQFVKALKTLETGEKLDNSELSVKLQLAHALLLDGEFIKAKRIYKKYQSQNLNDTLSWNEKVKIDFDQFQKSGINSEDFNIILKLIQY